jgi:hypothetical protein
MFHYSSIPPLQNNLFFIVFEGTNRDRSPLHR